MNYSELFFRLVREESQPLPTPSSTHEIPDDAATDMFDQDTDVDQLETTGISDVIARIEGVFSRKMALLVGIDQLSPDEVNSRLDELDEYIENLEPYMKTKDMDITDPYSVMANIIRNNPRKKTAFDKTVSAISDYRETVRKNEDLIAAAAKDLQSKVGQLTKAQKNDPAPPEVDTTPQF